MRRLAFALALGLAAPAFAGERTVTLSVPGMYCASCPYIVQSAIGEVAGVQWVEADLETRTATVSFDDETTTIEAIVAASTNAGYPATPEETGS